MSELSVILQHNRRFVECGEYDQYFSQKYPARKLAILSCMDARMVELLPQAMGLKNGDVKLIKNAGALVTHRWGSVMRSLLLAVYELKAREIMVVAHHDCGVRGLNAKNVLDKAVETGIPQERIKTLKQAGIDLEEWLHGFDCVEDSVNHTVKMIKTHPLMSEKIAVHGLIIHPDTGELEVVVEDSVT